MDEEMKEGRKEYVIYRSLHHYYRRIREMPQAVGVGVPVLERERYENLYVR